MDDFEDDPRDDEQDESLVRYIDESGQEITVEEVLISMVQERPVLWDHRLPVTNRDKTKREKAWTEITESLGGVPTEWAKKWKNIRDEYMKQKQKELQYVPSGSGSKKTPKKWKHFESCQFLDTVKNRSTKSNLQSSLPKSNTESEYPNLDDQNYQANESFSKRKRKTEVDNEILKMLRDPAPLAPVPPPLVCNNIEREAKNTALEHIGDLIKTLPVTVRRTFELEMITKAYDLIAQYSTTD